MNRGLPEKAMAPIIGVLTRFTEVERALLFGSRAKGTQKSGSDIDLALVGDSLDWRTIGRINDALDDLLLPYRFSLIQLDLNTDPDVAAQIARVGIPVFHQEAITPQLRSTGAG